jgi:hypothetical protein
MTDDRDLDRDSSVEVAPVTTPRMAAVSGNEAPLLTPAPDDDDPTHESHASEANTSYLPEQTSSQASERWQRIQSEFVDDPRRSVTQAHELVGELTQRIVDAFAKERSDLERQWSKGDSVSTEDMRVCLQRYRAFFSRLLPSVDKLDANRST